MKNNQELLKKLAEKVKETPIEIIEQALNRVDESDEIEIMTFEGYAEVYKEIRKNKEIIDGIDKDFFFDFVDTMLNYIENSISKKKVEEKIEKNNKKIYGSAFISTRYENKLKMENVILQELLEEE